MSTSIDDASVTATQKPLRVGDILHDSAGIEPGTTDQLLPGLLESIRLHLDMEVGFISQFQDGRRHFLHVSATEGRELICENSSDALEDSVCLKVVEGKVPNLVHDAQIEPGIREMAVTSQLGIRTHASVPIQLDDGEIFGTLCCFSTQSDTALEEKDIAFMSVIADLIGTAVQREQLHNRKLEKAREDLLDILHSGALQMVWQPVNDSMNRRITAVEALARFRTEPYRPPNEWFDEAGAINMGTKLERNAFIKGVEILPELPEHISVGFNVSGATVLDKKFQDFLMEQNLGRLVIEITEHDVINDYQALTEALQRFRRHGLKLAVDDFGAGYASFRHILNLEPDLIKLDMSLVRNIDRNAKAQAIVRALVAFATDSANRLLAEGVETEAELATLNSLGITFIQGYLLHKPLERDRLLAVIDDELR